MCEHGLGSRGSVKGQALVRLSAETELKLWDNGTLGTFPLGRDPMLALFRECISWAAWPYPESQEHCDVWSQYPQVELMGRRVDQASVA